VTRRERCTSLGALGAFISMLATRRIAPLQRRICLYFSEIRLIEVVCWRRFTLTGDSLIGVCTLPEACRAIQQVHDLLELLPRPRAQLNMEEPPLENLLGNVNLQDWISRTRSHKFGHGRIQPHKKADLRTAAACCACQRLW